MTDEVADHGAVLPLDPGLVVLAVGPGMELSLSSNVTMLLGGGTATTI